MPLRSLFEISLVLMILSGGASLSLAEGSPVPILALGIVSLHQSLRGWRPALSRFWVSTIAGCIFLFALVDYTLFAGGDVLIALGHLVVGMQILRIYQGWHVGGVSRILLLGFMQVVVAAAVTVSGIFIIPFLSFIVFSACLLSLYRFQRDPIEKGALRAGPGILASVAFPPFLVIAAAVAIFFCAPRVGSGWFGHSRGATMSMVGFGNEIGLDDIGLILDNPEVVMQVITEPLAAAKYWRGKVFDDYDGRLWTPFRGGRGRYAFSRGDGSFSLPPGRSVEGETRGDHVVQTFHLGVNPPRVIFACLEPLNVRFITPWPDRLDLDAAGAIQTQQPRRLAIRYQVTSRLPRPHLARGVTDEEMGTAGGHWLGLNDSAIDVGKLRGLAIRIADDAGANTPYEKARAIEEYLRDRGGFGYTLDIPRKHPEARDPVESFLFYRKEGHCEYFASAMVLLLRTLRIPARLINGFKEGEWNPVGRFYLVRQRHAHAWTEVHFGERVGWISMDPTPSVEDPSLASAFRSLGHLIDYLKYQWVTRVITYNAEDQAGALRKLRWFVEGWVSRVRSVEWWRPPAWVWAILLVGSVSGLGLWRLSRSRRPVQMAVRVPFYRELIRLLGRRGLRRRLGETPMELARRVLLEGGEAWGAVLPITDAYYRVRFGGGSLRAEEEAEIRGGIRRLRGLGRRRRNGPP